ncbi:nesprin-2 isoform X5 [Aquarana catesbeiana]|uniref:nesprin-2 isoform X5 n=1 Tax=Aquarana catesbeiana TaxID=8400 RepID=UPI003CC9AA81
MSSDSGSSISAGEDQQLAIDQLQQVLQAEQEGTQKRTFSNWINSQLLKHQQQSAVTDLYADIRNGHILLDLLEVLSGEVLPREKGKNFFQSRSNIESALTFLGKRSIKLINIHVEDIISGKPSIVLGLIWQIILHFHIEGLASILAPDDLQPVKCDTKKEVSPTASPSPKRSARSRWKISAQKVLLHWAQEQCARVGSVNVKDFKSSWKNGQAFLAIIHSLRPDLIDMEKFQVKSNEEKLREAFRIAEEELKIPRLLEPEDVNVSNPDEKSIMTYVAQFLQYSKNRADLTGSTTDRVGKAMEWLNLEEQTLKKLFSEMKDETYTKKYQEILLFMRKFNEQKRIYMSDLAVETLQPEEQRLIKQSLENITFQIAAWKEQLDHSLPPPLGAIESWLSEVENLMSQTLPESGSHHNTMSLLQALSVSFKALMIHATHHSESLRSFQNVDDNGVILVPADKTEEMKTRVEKILAANFSVLVDYRFSAHCVLALLEEGWPKLKAWKGKYKSQEAVESLLADYNEFVGEKQFMVHLENAFQKFKELHNQLLTTEEYSDDSEIATQYKKIESKYETFLSSAQEALPVLEKVQTCWIQFENNISLITVWLDEQHKMHPGHVPMEILSKWKSVHKSLNRDGNFLMEKTNEKAASKLSHRLKSFNNRWTRYLKLYEEEIKGGMGSEAQDDQPDGTHAGDFAKQTEVSAQTLRTCIQTLQKSTTAESVQPCVEILSNLEKLEKLAESVNVWAEGAEQVLTTTHPQEIPEESVMSTIQDFYENGIFHQEELAKAEMTVHAVAHLILTHKDMQHFSVDGLKRNIVQAHEKVQELVSRLGFALHPPEKPLLEKDIKINFERSKGDLETYITSAMTLMGQRVTPEEFISQYEETVGKFSVRKLEKFLKAADQMRTISSDKEKLAVDEVSDDLRHRWKIVHGELESYASELKQLIQNQKYVDPSCKLKTQISKAVHQNGDSIPKDTETKGPTLDKQLQIYEAQKRNLELLLQRSREKLDAESPHEAQDVNELQSRYQELEVLLAQLTKSWRQLESTSQAMENILSGDQKANCSETMSALQSGMKEVTEEINIRIQSLLITINVLLPIEEDVSVLCESNLQSPVKEMEKFTVSSIGSVYKDLQEFQSSVEDQIQRCDDLESAADVIDAASPVDVQAVQSIVQEYKLQLGVTSEAMKERETLLKDLESFLSSLASTKWSIQTVAAVSEKDRTIILQKQRNIELLEQKVHRLRMEAKALDDCLVPAGIYLEDPEHGGETSCLKMVDGFFEKIEIAKQAVLQELRNLDTQDSEIPSLNGASYSHLSSDDDVPSGLNDRYQEEKMETFLASKIDSVLQEIKEVQTTFENEIQHCDSLDLSSTEPTLNQYKMELKATNELMRERETTLKALDNFLFSLKAAKASIDSEFAVLVMDRETLLEKQRNLEELEKDIYRLGQEAEKLDDNLQVAEITLKDPEYGGVTSCQKMITTFFDKLENAQQAVLRDLQSLQESEELKTLNNRQRALCKNIEDIQDQIDKIGLRDPTIHAVQQRIKSLMQLEKKLESFINEKTSISTGLQELLHTTRSKDICRPEECDMLWEDAMQNITHSKEQCEAVIELLRKFQSYKKELTSLIQKAETLMPCQSSYVGKEILQETLKKVKAVKQEFDDHSEDVDEISSTCKKLQFQINQIKSFEESPFQTEANTIIDKWLDITEKLESYNENLKSAISVWNKIQHFLEDIEQWSELRKKAFEASDLTREDILQLNIEVENHEKHLEEISKLSREIQNLLQIELPLELQVIQTNLQSKVTSLSKFASEKANLLEKSPISPVPNPPFTCSTDGELAQIHAPPTGETSRDTVQILESHLEEEHRYDSLSSALNNKMTSFYEELVNFSGSSRENAPCELKRQKLQELRNQYKVLQKDFSEVIRVAEGVKQSTSSPQAIRIQEALDMHHCKMRGGLERLDYLKEAIEQHPLVHKSKKKEPKKGTKKKTGHAIQSILEPSLQPVQLAEKHTVSPTAEPLVETGKAAVEPSVQPAVDLSAPASEPPVLPNVELLVQPSVQSASELRIKPETSCEEKLPLDPVLKPAWLSRLQTTSKSSVYPESSVQYGGEASVEPLVQPLAEHFTHPDSLSSALNTKMARFSEELLNFSGSSQANTARELKRQKLQELRDQYEILQNDLAEVSQVAEGVKQSTSSPKVLQIQEALDMHHCKMRGYLEQLDYLKEAIEQPPLVHKIKKKEPKKVTKKKTGHAAKSTLEPSLQPSVQPIEKHTVLPTIEPSLESSGKAAVEPSVQPAVDLPEPAPEPPVHVDKLSAQPSVQSAGELWVTPGPSCEEKLVLDLALKPAQQPTVQTTAESLVYPEQLVQYEGGFSVRLPVEPLVQPIAEDFTHPAAKPFMIPVAQSLSLPAPEPSVQPTVDLTMRPAEVVSALPAGEPSMLPKTESSVQLEAEPSVPSAARCVVQHSGEPFVEPDTMYSVQHTTELTVQPGARSSVQPLEEPANLLDSSVLDQSSEQSLFPVGEPSAQPDTMHSVQHTAELTVQASARASVQLSEEPFVPPDTSFSVQPKPDFTVQAGEKPSIHPLEEPADLLDASILIQSAEQSMFPVVKRLLQPSPEPAVDLAMQPPEVASALTAEEPSMLPETEASVQLAAEPSVPTVATPSMQPLGEPFVPPKVSSSVQPAPETTDYVGERPSVQPSASLDARGLIQPPELYVFSGAKSSLQPTAEPSVQPAVDHTMRPPEVVSALPTGEPSVLLEVESSVQLAAESSVSPTARPTMEPLAEPFVPPDASTVQPEPEIVLPGTRPSVQPSGESFVLTNEISSVQPTPKTTVQPDARSSLPYSVEPSVKTTVEPSEVASVWPLVGPSMSTVIDSLVPPEVEHTLHLTVQPAERPSIQHAPEPSKQNIVGLSLQSTVELKEHNLVDPSGVVELATHSLAAPSEGALQAKIQAVKTSEQDSDNHAAQVVAENVVHNVLVQAVQDPVVLTAQEAVEFTVQVKDQTQPHLEVSTLPDKPLYASPDQTPVQTSKSEITKERKSSKGKKKKKLIAASYTADKQAVNGVTSPVEKTSILDHSEEDVSAEFVQMKINQDASYNLREVAKIKGLEECVKITEEQQEAIGQLQMCLNDCDSFRRQLETSLSDLPAVDNESLRIFALLTTVEEKLCQAKMLSDDGGRVVILKEVKPLYDEIKSYMECLSKVAAKIPCTVKMEEKKLDNLEDVVGVNAQDTQLVSKPLKSSTSRDATTMLSVSFDNEAVSAPEEPLPLYTQFQKQMQEILSHISHAGGDSALPGKTLEKFSSHIKHLCVREDDKIESDQSPEGLHVVMLKSGIENLKKNPPQLTLNELAQHIKEIEKLHNDISRTRSQESAVQKANGDSRGSELLLSKCEDLLNELTVLRTEKKTLYQVFKSFQDALCAARQAYQMLCKEKENLKVAPTESHTSQLDKRKHFLDKVEKEKVTLHVLKAEQANIGYLGISSKDKDRIENEVNQIEDLWEQIEFNICRECDCLNKEAEEFAVLKGKVDDIRSIIQVQQDLLDQPSPSSENVLNASLGLFAEMQAIKHSFILLRNACDLQMKRTWAVNERQDLENSLDSLQRELENLEERVKDRQLTRCQTPDAFLEQCPSLQPIYSSLLWVKKSQEKSSSEKGIALLLGDVEWQTTTYKKVQKEILSRKSAVDSAIGESNHIAVSFDEAMSKDFSSFLQQLQELYQEQIIQSTSRLQQLEIGWEKRKALFSEIEKLKELLQCLEKEATPVKRGIFTETELCAQLNCLKAKTTEMEEIEGLVLTLLRNSQSYHGELKSSEQLYLNDILRSLKSKARRIRRLEEKTFCYTKKLLSICNDFQERLTSLHRNLNALQPSEPKMQEEVLELDREVFEKKLQLSQNAVSSSKDLLSQILRYKDLFKDNRLHWDDLTIDDLQKKCLSFTERSGHSEHCGLEQGHYQELSQKIRTMVCSLQRESDTTAANFDIIAAQVACKKIKKISVLIAEALGWLHTQQAINVNSLRDEEQSLTVLAENMDRSYQALSQLVGDYYKSTKHSQHQVKQALYTLNKIVRELQEPFLNELDENELQERLLRLEALGEISKTEVQGVFSVSSLSSTDDLSKHLREVENTGQQIEKRLSEQIKITKETCAILQNMQKAIAKVAELFREYEEMLQRDHDFALSSPREKFEVMDSKEEELNVAIAKIQNIAHQLKPICSRENQRDLYDIFKQISNKNHELAGIRERKQSILASYGEKYQFFKNKKQKILEGLEDMEIVIGDSFLQKPASYKAALEQWEKSKNMMAKIQSYEEELLELKLISRDLSASIDDQLLEKIVYSLWDRWLYLLGITRDLELYGDELKQEWKFITELLEREMILLDNCQEEILDWPEVSQRTPHLQNLLAEIERFEENVQMQQMQLLLLKHRIQNILGIPESGLELVPVIKEIQAMQAKCEGLLHKAQMNKQEIETELQEREALKDEISEVNKSARDVSSSLENMEITDVADTKTSLEEYLRLVCSEKEKAQVIMEKLQDRYAETVPEELQSYATLCQEFLHETEEKVRNEIEQCSPQNIMTKRVNEISAGLKNIEAQLTVKTENIFQAKELQKKVWDEVDSWHSKLHALESEVQDMAEEDPSLAQEWMDKVTEPLNYYQQVTYLAERRSSNLNKATSKLEECEDTLKSTKLWIQITDGLINTELKDCSAKVLYKHVNALMIALDDAEGKLFLLDTISSELGEISVICETDKIVESLGEVKRQVKGIQQRILNVLPQIQYLTKEVGTIENEVKKMEKKVGSIRTILTSSDIDDMSPIEHHRHGQVILENIDSIRRTVADIEAYRPALPLSASGVRSLCVFRRMGRLLREAEVLEKVTKEQNKLLEPIIGEMLELEQEQENLKHISKNFTYETPDIKERTEELRKLMDGLNQKKEGVLLSQRSSVIDQLVRLQQEPEDQDLAALLSPVTDGVDHLSDEMHWNDPCNLPSLAEEVEESSLTTEAEDKVTVSEAVDLNVKAKEDASNYFISPVTLDQITQEQLENAATESCSVKPEMILHDCQGKVTEVELWLQRVNLSLAESTQEPDMRQSLEQKLVDFQKTLQETEKKINSLLEGAGTNKQRPSSLLEEAESLSRKLKALKISLENLQAMLQVRPNAEQVKSTETTENKYPTDKPVPSQEIVESLQNRNAAGEGNSGQIRPRGKSYLPEDITWSKWQYLQKELSHRSKATPLSPANEPEAEKEVKINLISRFPGRTIKPVPPEDSKQLLTRLRTLSEEADTSLPQESGMNLHNNLFIWLCSVSQWLQKVEERLDTDISREEASLELANYEKLSADLNSLSEEMKTKMDSLLKHISHEGENVGVLSQCYNDIRNWLVQTRGVLSSRMKCMHEELEKQNNYQNDIRQLYDMLTKRKSVLQQLGNRSGCEAAVLKESAAYETELQNIESQLSVLSEKGEKLSIPISSNQEIHKLQDVLDESWRILRVKQDEYSGVVIAKSQVDALLSGVTDLLSFGKENILMSKDYKCASKEALNVHIEEHKKFFNILDSQVLLLQALFSKNSTPTDCKHIAETVHEADILNKEAGAHCIHMMAVMKEWDEFDSRYNDLCKKMEAHESLVPTKSLVEESVERVNERLRQYQQIKLLLEETEPRLSWALMPGKRLQPLVRCRDLDSQILRMEQWWSQLTQKVSHELHRLESLGSHLASYNRDSAELSAWLSSAYQKLNNFRTQSLDVSQDLDTTKDNLHRFFEFTIEMFDKTSLKTSVLSTGTQLLRLKEADPAMLKLSLAKYEEQWTEIIAALPPIQEKLQQQLLEKLPSLQAIQEVMDWMKNIEQSNAETVPTTTSDIRSRLQKYKTLREEMSYKQCIVDFINQSLPQLSVGDVEGKRYERTELAELLGTLNLQWNMMRGDLNKKIQHVEQTLESTSDQESRRQSVNNWLDAQQVRLNKLQKPSTLTAAESVLAECSELEEQIKAKSNVLEELERSEPPAGDHNVFQQGLLTSENLMKKRNAFAGQVADLKSSIHSLLRHWKTYNENFECVKKMLVKLLYVDCQAKRPISSLNCLKQNLTILQSTQEEAEQHEDNWSKIRAALKSMEGLCSPSAIAILGQDCKEAESRWTPVNEKLSSHLQSARLLLQLWEAYSDSYQNHTLDMEQLEGKCQQLLYAKLSEDKQADTLQQRIQDLQVLEQSLQALRAHNLQVSELADKVIRQNAAAADVIYSERQNTSHRIDHLERSVSSKTAELKQLQKEVEAFKDDLENLQSCVKSSADFVGRVCLSQKEKEERSEPIKKHLLELRERSADIEHLNEETFTLPLDDRSLMLLQNLNRSWEKTGEMALEDCREHRVNELDRNNFIQNYETWMQCVEKMENNLTMGTAGTYEVLKKQQAMYEKLQAEVAINEHILHAFVTKALSVLESEEEENRGEVILKLTSLKKKWQSVISLVQQRNRENTILLKQWRQFRVSKQRLENNLSGVQAALSSVSPQKCYSLINAEKLLYDFKEKERHLNRLQSVYNTMVENGKDLLAVAEPESKEALQCDLNRLQDLWQKTTLQLQAVLIHFNDMALKRENFEQNVEDRRKSLHGLKVRVDEPLPTLHEDLQRFRQTVKELEEALDEWGDGLKELDNMKAELSQYIVAEDGVVLKKQVEALHRQWEELCLRVSMRKQEIEDRLNAWNVFNEKNKELCDWLTQMESKVSQTADVNIKEMIEKLQKDCMEEINLFSENKLHLKQIGDQLIIASNKARSTDIENKLNKVNDRWKHLFDVIGSRVKKLKETLVIIQQLDKNMSNLRTWLARIESELSKPVIYSICDDQEINKKLEEQKDLQKDIELHSTGVSSVLSICERLLHDTDACANETECDSIQQTTRSLDKRWRNICTMSMERRLRIEETWRLWQKFLEDYSKFDDWLKEAEAMAASPDSSDVLYTKAKEEQKRFEAFQRQIHERLTHLELINKQYRRLARENRTDAASRLKQMVHEGNQSWDQLQRRVAAILRRLKHFTSQREDFEGTRDCILVWLTEMDLQLTNVEHFSESDIEEKMQQLAGFKQEITLNTNKIDQLIVFGEQLIQKSEAMDAVIIEDELEEIHRYCQEVFGRVYRFHERLTSRGLHLEEERETSENDTDGEDSREIQNSSWHSTIPEVETSHQSLCHLMPPPPPHERSGRETPVSVSDSIPLEWDPTVDVGGSSMNENEEEGAYYNPLSDVEIAESPEAYVIMTTKTVQASSGTSGLETPSWHSPDKHMAVVRPEYKQNETAQDLISATIGIKASIDGSTNGQMSTSTPSRKTKVRTSGTTNEQVEDQGFRGIYSPETHSGVIERWEIIQAQSLSNELSAKQNLQQWQKLNSDLDDISLWLEQTEAELDSAGKIKPATSIQELEQKVKQFKDTLKVFDNYKPLVLSANLSSKEFQQADDVESGSLLSRLHDVNSRWDQACHKRDKWRESLQNDLNQCEEFHETSHQLLLWLTEAESRRLKYRVADHKGDPHALLEYQRQLMQLEEQLQERQIQANSLQDMSSSLLESNVGGVYVEADERTHVIATKMKQLLKDVSRDLKTVQRALDDCTLDEVDSMTAADSQNTVGALQDTRNQEPAATVQETSKKRSFFYRVLRAALPLQLLLLLLLLLACMIPFSEEDYSCAQANNFARSFYPMLRYTNGPPPT